MKVGILALQGAVEPHEVMLRRLGVATLQVRTPEQLSQASALILPGGESTTMLHLLGLNRLWEPLTDFVRERPVLGVCAGAILLAESVQNPTQASLARIPMEISRNAYGRQVASFVAPLDSRDWTGETVQGVFIRAPRITRTWGETRVLLSHGGEPVLVRHGTALAGTFHPELTEQTSVHQYFLNLVEGAP